MSKPARISDKAHKHILAKAIKEDRSFISQLDRELGIFNTVEHKIEAIDAINRKKNCKNGHVYRGTKCTQKKCL